MKITTTVVAQCCKDWRFEARYKHEVISALLNHIRRKHPTLLAKLKREGRSLARSQNGCRYWDSNSSFRNAWIENALENTLEDLERLEAQ